MIKLTFSNLKQADLKPLVLIQPKGIAAYQWTEIQSVSLTQREEQQLQEIKDHLLNYDTHLMNEATIWARAIYPLLLLAEQDSIQAWAEIPLQARYVNFQLEGIVDGVLGKCIAGLAETPYLVVLEAKRGLENENPLFQLYGQLLAAAHFNWENDGHEPQEIFGCYTIADNWKFLRAEIDGMEADKPSMRIEYSREYSEKLEADIIFKILKQIVSKHCKIHDPKSILDSNLGLPKNEPKK
jgi:hypothetical protein